MRLWMSKIVSRSVRSESANKRRVLKLLLCIHLTRRPNKKISRPFESAYCSCVKMFIGVIPAHSDHSPENRMKILKGLDMMIAHNSPSSGLERMNRKWAALVAIHYSLSAILLHVNNVCTDTAEPSFPLLSSHTQLSSRTWPAAKLLRACKHPTKHFIIQLHLMSDC